MSIKDANVRQIKQFEILLLLTAWHTLEITAKYAEQKVVNGNYLNLFSCQII